MTKALTNYDKIKISTAHVFLQYNQATMIHKYSLDYNSDWLYITFINRTYRINRKTGSVQWSDNDFEIMYGLVAGLLFYQELLSEIML